MLYFNQEINARIKNKYGGRRHLFYFETQKIQNIQAKEIQKKIEIGENDEIICSLIRKDDLVGFIDFSDQNDIQFSMTIKPSIFETNSFLLKKNPTLIEYSAFFGSKKIFSFLLSQKVDKSPQNLWIYSIHSNDKELISILENNEINIPDDFYVKIITESIKCHHNEITKYLIENKPKPNCPKLDFLLITKYLKYHNYYSFKEDDLTSDVFYYACKYNHPSIVKILSDAQNANFINRKIIFYKFFLAYKIPKKIDF